MFWSILKLLVSLSFSVWDISNYLPSSSLTFFLSMLSVLRSLSKAFFIPIVVVLFLAFLFLESIFSYSLQFSAYLCFCILFTNIYFPLESIHILISCFKIQFDNPKSLLYLGLIPILCLFKLFFVLASLDYGLPTYGLPCIWNHRHILPFPVYLLRWDLTNF
jgi:hypothetical protein